MRIAVLTPLPPVRSGIAHYSSILLPAMARRHDVTAVVDQQEHVTLDGCGVIPYASFDARNFDAVVCQLGNNPFHEFVYREAMRSPSIVVLHDLVLHHLIVEMTLARGDAESYIQEIRTSHGEIGAALARGRRAGFHGEIGNFLYPASTAIANRSRAVIVHTGYAAESLRRLGVQRPIVIVEHPYVPAPPVDAREMRRRLGYTDDQIVIGLFGFITAAKRPEVVFEAFSSAARRDDNLRLLVVGQPAPNIDLMALATRFGTPLHSWRTLGYVADAEFDQYLAAVDRVINLRFPSAGEASGPLIRVFAAGKPVAVSDYAQFAEYPDTIVRRIPLGEGEAAALREFFLERLDAQSMAERQREWLEKNASLDVAVDSYQRAISGKSDIPEGGSVAAVSLPVLASLSADSIEATHAGDHWDVSVQLRNNGSTLIRTGVYGEPGYRVLVKAFHGEQEVFDQWVPLASDLHPGGTTSLRFRIPASSGEFRLELSHAIEGVPHFELPPFATAELRS